MGLCLQTKIPGEENDLEPRGKNLFTKPSPSVDFDGVLSSSYSGVTAHVGLKLKSS